MEVDDTRLAVLLLELVDLLDNRELEDILDFQATQLRALPSHRWLGPQALSGLPVDPLQQFHVLKVPDYGHGHPLRHDSIHKSLTLGDFPRF